jgi:hypothetical protein
VHAADVLDVLGPRPLAGKGDGDVAGEAHEEERERGHRERDEKGEAETLQREGEHGLASSAGWASSVNPRRKRRSETEPPRAGLMTV